MLTLVLCGAREPNTIQIYKDSSWEIFCKLHAVSLGGRVSGPCYTYKSGDTVTTVDYIVADIEASSCIDTCQIHSDDDLNTSDNLALAVTLSCNVPTQFSSDPNWMRIDWT